jgi:hypothetical protein
VNETQTAVPRPPDPLTVAVTAGHIRNGKASDCLECPLALALDDALRVAGAPAFCTSITDVDASAEYVPTDSTIDRVEDLIVWRAPLPDTAIVFVQEFDNAQRVEPFDFELTGWRRVDGNV